MKDLIIRRAYCDDAEEIIEYLNKIGGESDNLLFGKDQISVSVEKEKKFIESINSSEKSLMLIGVINNEIVSVACIQGYSRDRIAHRGNFSISVRKSYWHLGIGTKMIKEIIEFSKSVGITVIELEVKAENINAISLYEKMGFEKIGVYKKFFKIRGTYYDAYMMNLYL